VKFSDQPEVDTVAHPGAMLPEPAPVNERGGGNLRDNWRYLGQFALKHRTQIICLAIAYGLILGFLGIQNVPFWDDAGRQLQGFSRWGSHDARWGSELFAFMLNSGFPVVDLGLLTFILSALILTLTSVLMIYLLVPQSANWVTFAVALAMGVNPWFLNGLAFRFDGPFFAFSLLLAVLPATGLTQSRKWVFTLYAICTWLTFNFYQTAVGVLIALALTVCLLRWLRGVMIAHTLTGVFLGVAAGAVAYLIQVNLIGARQDIGFDFRSPIGALVRNLRTFLLAFLGDNPAWWLSLYLAVFLLVIFALMRQPNGRRPVAATLGIVSYIGLAILASGGALLLAVNPIIGHMARFRFSLAVWIAIGAIIVSGAQFEDRVFRYLVGAILVLFSYAWVSFAFMFSQYLRNEDDALRFQAGVIFQDVLTIHRPGDQVIYDSLVFQDSQLSQQMVRRYPIFANPSYAERPTLDFHTVRWRLAGITGIPENDLLEIGALQRPSVCDVLTPTGPVLEGSRWNVWRSDERTICVTTPLVARLAASNGDSFTLAIPAGPNPQVALEHFTVEVWSVHNQDDLRVFTPFAVENGELLFAISPPPNGWTDEAIAAHFRFDDDFRYQLIWNR